MKKDVILRVFKVLQLLALSLLIACAEERKTQFPDGQGNDIFEVSLFKGEMEVTTEAKALSKPGFSTKAFYKVDAKKIEAPQKVKRMFHELPILGAPANSLSTVTKLSPNRLTVYKLLAKPELTNAEKAYAVEREDALFEVPLFSYAIQEYGVLVKKKNDYGESTSTLRIEPTEFSEATHIKVDLNTRKRKLFAVSENNQKELFLKGQFTDMLISAKEVYSKLNVKLNAKPNDKFITKLNGSNLMFFLVTTVDSGRLKPREIEALNGDLKSDMVRMCTKEEALIAANATGRSAEEQEAILADFGKKCVLTAAHVVHAEGVELSLDKDFKGELTGELVVRRNITNSPIIEIVADAPVRSLRDEINVLDPNKVISLANIQSKEFLFRVTIEDSPNEFAFTFTGSAGPLEIVKFVPTDKSIKVVRSRALTERGTTTGVDLEVLMSIPVSGYYKKLYKSATGQNLTIPRIVSTTKEDPKAFAVLNWAVNQLNQTVSPMNRLNVCFSRSASKEVSAIAHKLDAAEGMLNFSVSSDYSAKSFCTNQIERRRWFATGQKNFTFKERYSFKEYKHISDDPMFNIPLKAQKLLGFGLFTYEKNKPNNNGNIGNLGTRVHLPAVFDLTQGKGIHYILAGLPDDPSSPSAELERKLIIQATKDVVKDLNIAMAQALKGSQLAHLGNVISLSIEGAREGEGPDAGKGVLGDLDRNYIYYVQKASETRIIGLGGSHSNPVNGRVEAASVFIYGGNMKSSVEYLLRREATKGMYENIMSRIIDPSQGQQQDGSGTTNAETESSAKLVRQKLVTKPLVAKAKVDKEKSIALEHAHQHHHELGKEHQHSRAEHMKSFTEAFEKIVKNDVQLKQDIASFKDLLDFPLSSKLDAADVNPNSGVAKALYHTYVEATKQGVAGSSRAISALMHNNLLKHAGNTLTSRQKAVLKSDVLNFQAMSKIFSNLQANDICVYEVGNIDIAGLAAGVNFKAMRAEQKISKELELLVKMYKPTLAHEIGHNLGLRHNFISSYDKANWKFHADDTSSRNYSSVMDYATDDHNNYDGLGPHDVAALRAAYGQMLELDPTSPIFRQLHQVIDNKDQLVFGTIKIPLSKVKVGPNKDTYLISLENYKSIMASALGLRHWDQFDTPQIADQLPVHNYMFCSDEEAGLYPTCNRFDKGASPTEIVENIVKDQRALYSLTNFKNDRLEFDYMNLGGYIGKLFSQYMRIRHFLEETIYMAVRGGGEKRIHGTATVNDFAQAAVQGLMFFNSVVAAPDTLIGTSPLSPFDRFVHVQVPNTPIYVPVEMKWPQNLQGNNFGDLAVIGQEFDKAIALIMLTDRNIGFPRYLSASIRMSYPIFESLIFGNTPVENHPTMSLLKSVVANDLTPVGVHPMDGSLFPLPMDFKAETTEMVRLYGILGGIVNSDVNGQEDELNLSKHFRVFSSKKEIQNVLNVMPKGTALNDPFVDKLSTSPRYKVANSIVTDVYRISALQALQPRLAPLMVKWLNLSKLGDILPANLQEPGTTDSNLPEEAIEKQRLADVAAVEKEIQTILNEIPNDVLPAEGKDFKTVVSIFQDLIDISEQIKEQRKNIVETGQVPPDLQILYKVNDASSFERYYVGRQRQLIQRFSKVYTSIAAVLNTIIVDGQKHPDLAGLISSTAVDFHRERMFGNLETLNTFYGILHGDDATMD